MPFTLQQFVLVSLILFASSVVQGAVGFAAGLFGIPLLMLTGIPLADAVAISFVAAAVQNCIPCWQLRREIDFRGALRPMLIRFATMPLGVIALGYLGQENNKIASQVVGVLVLLLIGLQLAARVQPQPKLHPAWEWLAFSLGGFLLGLCGMGGPPMALWVLAHDLTMNRARAFLYFIFVSGLPLWALLLWLRFGQQFVDATLLGAIGLPAVLVGLYAGLYLSRVIPDRALRGISIGVLVLIAVSAILTPYLR
jgi:uncharacterized protein